MSMKSFRTPWKSEILSNRADSFFYSSVGVWRSAIALSSHENRTFCVWRKDVFINILDINVNFVLLLLVMSHQVFTKVIWYFISFIFLFGFQRAASELCYVILLLFNGSFLTLLSKLTLLFTYHSIHLCLYHITKYFKILLSQNVNNL
jgi:hypothetical protein